MSDDDWVKLAMNDDVTVADLLYRLKQAGYQRRHRRPPPPGRAEPPLKLYWSVRQRRSRPLTRQHHHDVEIMKNKKEKKAEPTRASPTTPLSWSGATSVSGGTADGFEESSKPAKPTTTGGARSKVSNRGEGTTSKRPRKKKTLAELKEEETLLLRERKKLRSEVATMRLNIDKQRATNESLNRLKLDLDSSQKVKTLTIDRVEQVYEVCQHDSISPKGLDHNDLDALQCSHESNSPDEVKDLESEKESGFSLPDLNLPAGGDFSSSELLHGIS